MKIHPVPPLNSCDLHSSISWQSSFVSGLVYPLLIKFKYFCSQADFLTIALVISFLLYFLKTVKAAFMVVPILNYLFLTLLFLLLFVRSLPCSFLSPFTLFGRAKSARSSSLRMEGALMVLL